MQKAPPPDQLLEPSVCWEKGEPYGHRCTHRPVTAETAATAATEATAATASGHELKPRRVGFPPEKGFGEGVPAQWATQTETLLY
jgi:hypothetical protein